jgi:hypothetical protein
MSAEARRCSCCGAEAPRPAARYCEHCGAALPGLAAEERSPHGSSGNVADPFGDVPARFRALAAHPSLPELLRATPDVPELAGKTLPSVLLLLGLGVIGFLAALVCFQLCPPLGFVPLALVGVGVAVLARQLLWNARTPLTARPALVVEQRAKVQAGAEHSPAHTRQFVTLEREDGTRSEHECFASALASLAVGALGIAYLKGERLAAFASLPV